MSSDGVGDESPDSPAPLISTNVNSDGYSHIAPRELDYGPDVTRRKPLDVRGRRSGFIIAIISVAFFGFPPLCLLLSLAAAIVTLRALRSIEKGEEGRWMPITALAIAFAGAAWSAGLLFYLILTRGQ